MNSERIKEIQQKDTAYPDSVSVHQALLQVWNECEQEYIEKARIERNISLKNALKAVDEWLNSDDTWVTDKDGNKIEGGLIACNPASMTHKFIEKMS